MDAGAPELCKIENVLAETHDVNFIIYKALIKIRMFLLFVLRKDTFNFPMIIMKYNFVSCIVFHCFIHPLSKHVPISLCECRTFQNFCQNNTF